MEINLNEGENLILEKLANHFKKFEAVGGKLYITNQRIFFSSHNFNVQNHELIINYNEILSVGKRNTLFIVPNGMFIELKNGNKEKFVLWGRNQVITEIKKLSNIN